MSGITKEQRARLDEAAVSLGALGEPLSLEDRGALFDVLTALDQCEARVERAAADIRRALEVELPPQIGPSGDAQALLASALRALNPTKEDR